MKKKDLVKLVADRVDMPQNTINYVIDGLSEVIFAALAEGEDVRLPMIGGFSVVERAEHVGHNPQTGEKMTIPAHNAVKFKPSSSLKEAVY